MSFSWITRNRLCEREAANNQEYAQEARNNGKVFLSQGRALSDQELLEKLREVGVPDVDKNWLRERSGAYASAQHLTESLTENQDFEIHNDDLDWVWIALTCLWERWFPDVPNFEMLDDRIQAGYDANHKRRFPEAVREWSTAWRDIQFFMKKYGLANLEEFDEKLGGTQSVDNWIQDFSDALNVASRANKRILHQRIQFYREILALYEEPTEQLDRVRHFRMELADSYALVGQPEKADALYQEWLRDDPQWGRGWVCWSDIYLDFGLGKGGDYDKAKQILDEGLNVEDVRDRELLVERLCDYYEETDQPVEFDRLVLQNAGPEAILEELDWVYVGELPVGALRAAQDRKEEMIPHLIALLREEIEGVRHGIDHEGSGALFALFLLTEFSAKEAFPAILEGARLPDEGPFDLWGEGVTTTLCRVFAEFAVDSPDVVDELIADRGVNEYVRWSATSTYLLWVRDGRITREHAVEKLASHLRSALDREDLEMVGPLICELNNYVPHEALDLIEEAFQKQAVDESLITLDFIRSCMERGEAEFQENLERCDPTGVQDTVEELETWASFCEQPDYDYPSTSTTATIPPDVDWDEEPIESDPRPATATIRNTTPKIGRNEPCPCGSGKKYKKCCGKP